MSFVLKGSHPVAMKVCLQPRFFVYSCHSALWFMSVLICIILSMLGRSNFRVSLLFIIFQTD